MDCQGGRTSDAIAWWIGADLPIKANYKGGRVALRVLVGCECSGVVRAAFRARGHDAWSCDLKPAEDDEKWHLQCDVRDAIENPPMGEPWDMAIFFPDCTYLCSSGLHRNLKDPARAAKTVAAVEFAKWLLTRPIDRIALENPIGRLGTAIRKADQIIQPNQFGHDASKATCLWLKGLPKLRPTKHIPPRFVGTRPRWGNQTDSGQNRLGPSPTRAADRARTYPGIADAMAEQWGAADAIPSSWW